MTKKHFEAIAASFRFTRPVDDTSAEHRQWMLMVADMASVFIEANPRFDRERFINACMS